MYLNTFDSPTNPKRVGPTFANGRLQLYDCQMSFLFVSESLALQELGSKVTGASPAVLSLLKTQSNTMAAAADATLWDESVGIYKQVDVRCSLCDRIVVA
jgi:hypothetical protein